MNPFVKLIAAGILILTSGAAALAQPAPRTAIVLAPIGSSDMAAAFYAVQQGMFEKAGLDVTIQQAATGAASMVAVLGGGAQVGYGNSLALSTAHAKGIPIVLLSPGAQYNTNAPHAVLIVAADSTLKTPKDLEGHIVAVAGLHDLLTVSVNLWMEKSGVDASKVKFVEMPPGSMLPALQAKRVDAAVSYEPFLSSAVGTGAAKVYAKPYDAIGNGFLTGAWFTLGPWASQHREAAIRFAQILDQASQYVDAHYDDLIPLISQFSKLPPETLHKMVKVVVPPTLTAAALQPVVEAAVRAHEIPASIRAGEMIFPGVP